MTSNFPQLSINTIRSYRFPFAYVWVAKYWFTASHITRESHVTKKPDAVFDTVKLSLCFAR
jgi:hypothetical protein